jgi:hypothetical protein
MSNVTEDASGPPQVADTPPMFEQDASKNKAARMHTRKAIISPRASAGCRTEFVEK